jgi:hypothetical protein
MCNCNNTTCPKCDPGIEAFYQQKVEKAKEEAAYLKTTGYMVHYQDLLDAKHIWYEYCELRRQEEVERLEDENLAIHPENIENPDSWT